MPLDMPEDLMMAAQATDDVLGDELSALIPPFAKPVGPKVMNALAKAVQAAAAVMGMEVAPDTYTAPVDELEPDLVRFLSMFEAAADDYGKPFPIPLAEVGDEAALTALTAHLMVLAKDSGFSDFLDMPDDSMADEIDFAEPPVGEEAPMAADDFFASRMGPNR